MTPSSSSKVFFAIAMLSFSIVSCERDEPVEPQNVAFRLEVTEDFWKYKYNYIAIISDFEGNVLVIDYLNYKGVHELMVPQPVDGAFHLTLFDGYSFFTTYSFLPAGDYILDFNETQYSGDKGKHTVIVQESAFQASGKNVSFSFIKSINEAELWMTESVSDLYVYFERQPNNSPGYFFLPEIRINESTELNADENGKLFTPLPVTIKTAAGTNIFLYGDNDSNEVKMQYFLSRSGPLPAGARTMNVPRDGEPNVKFYRTVFSAFDGNTYTYTGETIATEQKLLSINVQEIETNSASVFYSIISDANAIEWSASGTNFHWTLFSQPGTNIKINLPKLPLTFRNGYDLHMMETLEFSTASLLKDSRFPTYMDLVKKRHLEDQQPSETPYEQLQRGIPVR